MKLELFAPAKVNLDLAITGVRDGGYHTLHSHVAFADVGDVIEMDVAHTDTPSCTLTITGPFAHQLASEDSSSNLAVRAANAFCQTYGHTLAIDMTLHKHLPCGSGLGGGSSDAAAVLRGLCHATDTPTDSLDSDFLTAIGADVPVCFHAQPCLMEGIGEALSPWSMADTDAVLIWPGPGGSTKALYQAWDEALPSRSHDGGNDFQPLAARFCPAINDALTALAGLPGCRKAQLSGSGTAIFGLLDTPSPLINLDFPWVQACRIGNLKKPLVTPLR